MLFRSRFYQSHTHRVAIGNQRLIDCEKGQVRFTWRDRRDGDRRKEMSLPADEFMHRILTHVLPDRFLRIRHYPGAPGLANRGKSQRLARIRQLLGAQPPAAADQQPHTPAEWMRLLGIDIDRCPCCGELRKREPLPQG